MPGRERASRPTVPCPICRRPVAEPAADDVAAGKLFPFCTDRCKLVDLGRWLDGRYQIPVRITADDEDDLDRG